MIHRHVPAFVPYCCILYTIPVRVHLSDGRPERSEVSFLELEGLVAILFVCAVQVDRTFDSVRHSVA